MKLNLPNMLDVLAHPGWLWRVMIPGGGPRFENLKEFLPPGVQSAMVGARFMATQFNTRLSWDDMERIRGRWKGKLVVKGILCVEDAKRAADVGADGIVLTNHGGRQLDSCVSGVELVPAVSQSRPAAPCRRQRFPPAPRIKAIALGAHGVMVGRPVLYGLAAGGQPGVAHALQILRTEMERVMMLLGCRSLADLGRHLIRS
jgi:(S)-mandelate dehydrogenase